MDLELSDEQRSLRDELRRFLAARLGSEALRACAELPGAVDPDLWRGLAGMGVFSLGRPEAEGGVGLGLAEAVIAFEELGRAAAPGPVIATFLAAGLPGELGARAAAGEAVVGSVPAPAPGEPLVVEHLDALDALLLVAHDGVTCHDPPEGQRLDRPLDPMTPVHVVTDLPAGEPVADADGSARLRRDAALLAAAMQVGLGEAAVVLGTAYAGERRQFGRVIGSFQAVKHLLADAHVWVDVARAAVHAAAVELDEGAVEAPTCGVDAARAVASRAAARATAACVQVHGGMGYTWDVDAHLLLKRAAVLDLVPTRPHDALAARAALLADQEVPA